MCGIDAGFAPEIAHRQATPMVTGKGDLETSRSVSNGEINREWTALKRAFTELS